MSSPIQLHNICYKAPDAAYPALYDPDGMLSSGAWDHLSIADFIEQAGIDEDSIRASIKQAMDQEFTHADITPLASHMMHSEAKTVYPGSDNSDGIPFADVQITSDEITIGGYRIERLIGVGGMSSVYLASRQSDHTPVAMKFLKPNLMKNDDAIERFIEEYRIAAMLDHHSIIKVYDQQFTDEYMYTVMEYLPGKSLKEKTIQPVSPRTAVQVAIDICTSLSVLHGSGIVHRDVKPSNFQFDHNGRLVLLDLGISKMINEKMDLTRQGESIGTPNYMSPEQVLEYPVDGRSDLYSLGVILYRMLTGKNPFKAKSASALMYRHAYAPAPRLPAEMGRLSTIVSRLLEKDPDDRYDSALQVQGELLKLMTHHQHKKIDETPACAMLSSSVTS